MAPARPRRSPGPRDAQSRSGFYLGQGLRSSAKCARPPGAEGDSGLDPRGLEHDGLEHERTDIGAGMTMSLGPRTDFLAELWYGIVSDASQLALRVGASYGLESAGSRLKKTRSAR